MKCHPIRTFEEERRHQLSLAVSRRRVERLIRGEMPYQRRQRALELLRIRHDRKLRKSHAPLVMLLCAPFVVIALFSWVGGGSKSPARRPAPVQLAPQAPREPEPAFEIEEPEPYQGVELA